MVEENSRYYTKNGIYIGLLNTINNLGVIGSFLYITYKLIQQTIKIADFTLYFNSLIKLIDAMNLIQENLAEFMGMNAALTNLFDFLEMDEIGFDDGGISEIDLSQVEIEFKNVSFKYPSSDDYVIKNCSFKINPKETIALVGKNGAGKSTIVKLLCKFYKASEGEILLNGVNINDINTSYYYSIISPTFQDFRIFPFRIDENVSASPSENISKDSLEEMEKNFKLLNIYDWVNSLAYGKENYLTTLFDQKGVAPSGGLAQKLALARSMHHKGKFIIMDEPTSALDPRSEQEIFENMLAITKDQTSLFISHRLSSTKYADRILVCNNGHIEEDGNHNELLKANKLYAKMFNTQKELYA